ncbi:MAG: putative galactose oxidase [Nitrospira sp.]|nr:putative galactose oxidase [Nitrospira sp.]
MANLGNAWHIPANPEPRGRGGMRDPIGAIVPGTAVTIISGNQFQGAGGNPGNQLQTGSAIFFKRSTSATWASVPMTFLKTVGNNKYYSGEIPRDSFNIGDTVQYYLRIPYDDHDTTFVHAGGAASITTAVENVAQAGPFRFALEDPAIKGQWGPVFTLPNIAAHAHVLPNGLILMWGRRLIPGQGSLDVHECTPFLWNPETETVIDTPQPKLANGAKVNLFCSGHAFLDDGRLLVMGGHNADSDGLSQAALYDWTTNTWTATAPMTAPNGDSIRRWYPTATTLPNGDVLVLSGSYIDPTRKPGEQTIVEPLLQIWSKGNWKTISKADGTPLDFKALPLYPRMHVASDGRVFMSGTNGRTLLLKTTAPGNWTEVDFRSLGARDYCPSVMYDLDKFIYIGGGNNVDDHAPTAQAEVIDLKANPAKWRKTKKPMKFARRQHNATVLPDGTVLVVGGTGGGGGLRGFNDLSAGEPVHVAELWDPDPAKESWAELSAESVDRCYHSAAMLLPDARVLSAGGGEYRPDDKNPNLPEDTHPNAQVFSPPYLFKGARPGITSAPTSVDYGAGFEVGTPQTSQIGKISWIRLPSVTHSFDENLRISFLPFQVRAGKLAVTAPASSNECPPGHYMLFLVNKAGVPSVAKIIQIKGIAPPSRSAAAPEDEAASLLSETEFAALSERMARPGAYNQIYAREAEIAATPKGTAVKVGITGTCPYGIGACWGGAYEALGRLDGVVLVSPVPNTDDSTAEVFLEDDRLPALDRWEEQFRNLVNGTYDMRGVEVTLRGTITQEGGSFLLVSRGQRPPVPLRPLQAYEKIQWNHRERERKPLEPSEAGAYHTLVTSMAGLASGHELTVTGALKRTGIDYELHVRSFNV